MTIGHLVRIFGCQKNWITSRSNYDQLLFNAKLEIIKWDLSIGSRYWEILSMNMRELNYQACPTWNWFSTGPKHHPMRNRRSPWVCIIESPLWICTRNIAIHQGSLFQKWMLLLKNYLSRLQWLDVVDLLECASCNCRNDLSNIGSGYYKIEIWIARWWYTGQSRLGIPYSQTNQQFTHNHELNGDSNSTILPWTNTVIEMRRVKEEKHI